MRENNEKNNQQNDLLTTKDVARRLKVSERTVHNYINRAGLEAIRLGGKNGHLRVRTQALKDWLDRTTINRD